jgi:hypothetical protein
MLESIIYVICDSGGWSGTLAAASADCCNSKITLDGGGKSHSSQYAV